MKRELAFSREARDDIQRLDEKTAKRILEALERFAETGQGDVKRLKGKSGESRLRVGKWRVRFEDDQKTIHVLHILKRDEAYRR